jgi:hypothetical protein
MQVFLYCFLLGSVINNFFYKYQKSLKNPNKLLLAFIQLFTIITIAYILQTIRFFQDYFEEYAPNVLFSSFLISLQTNMISNFKEYI